MYVTDLSSIPRSRGGKIEQKSMSTPHQVRLKLLQNIILFGAEPPSPFSVIYKNANYNANANTTE